MSRVESAEPLLSYTDWLRSQWWAHFDQRDDSLTLGLGENSGGRFGSVGEVIRHIFGGELRYVERIWGREAPEVSHVAPDSVTALFELGERSRAALRDLLDRYPEADWSGERVFSLGGWAEFEGTPWKVVIHVLLHEVRHWAQIGTLLRMQGRGPALHDFLLSPVLGGEFRLTR